MIKLIKWIKDIFDLKKQIRVLEKYNSALLDKNFELSVKTSEKYKIIYNPTGVDKWFINKGNTVYIQGKPINLDGFNCDEIIVINSHSKEFDITWFNKQIAPFGIVYGVKVLYVDEVGYEKQ